MAIPLLSLLPAAWFAEPAQAAPIPGLDKVIHAGIYGLHAALLAPVFRGRRGLSPRAACGTAAASAALYGLLMEGLQGGLTESRQFSWGDAAANTAGAVLAAGWLYLKWKSPTAPRPPRPEAPPPAAGRRPRS